MIKKVARDSRVEVETLLSRWGKQPTLRSLKFVDLFAGLGGFNVALSGLGYTCVFASEIDEDLRECYRLNFGIEPKGDIRRIPAKIIPTHDILCAGFPCQPFSKAGFQEGLEHPSLGDLYKEILRVIRVHHPEMLLFENVPNLVMHREGKTWEFMDRSLRSAGYDLAVRTLSPHHFGIPQIRERVYVVGRLGSLGQFKWPEPNRQTALDIRNILDLNPPDARPIPPQVEECLETWQEFLDKVPRKEKIPHPLWAMEFGATYPYKTATPFSMSTQHLRRFRGSFGNKLRAAKKREDVLALLPSHARRPDNRFPTWKIRFIERNRKFYRKHQKWIDAWKPKIQRFPSSYQKLEWNCLWDPRRLSGYLIQMRASGVRVKRPTSSPSLVAMTQTQLPIIGWENRYMTLKECKRLQSIESLEHLPSSLEKACEALGNAVNSEVARRVAQNLVLSSPRITGDSKSEIVGAVEEIRVPAVG